MPLFVRRPYMSDAPACKTLVYVRRPYMSNAPICQMQMPLYVRRPAPISQVREVYWCNRLVLKSIAPICQAPLFVGRPYSSDAPICQMPLFVRRPYLSDAPICQTPLFVRRPYLSDAPICQTPLFVRRPYLLDDPICQTTLFVRRPYLPDAIICQAREVYWCDRLVFKSIVSFLIKPRSRRLGGFLLCLRFIFFKPRSRRLDGFLLCLRFIYLFFYRAAVGVRGHVLPSVYFFFLVLSVTISKPPRLMFRGWCHHQPITGHFSALFVTCPLRRVLLT